MKQLILAAVTTMIMIAGLLDQSSGQSSKKASKQNKELKVEALKVEVGKAVVLEGVFFEAGSATITPASDAVLGRALTALKKNSLIEVEIRGYTDNFGDVSRNLRLSQNRADAVKMWLVKRGIPTTRINAKGYGSVDPIATNTTPEGRAQNRRIELFRIR